MVNLTLERISQSIFKGTTISLLGVLLLCGCKDKKDIKKNYSSPPLNQQHKVPNQKEEYRGLISDNPAIDIPLQYNISRGRANPTDFSP